MAPSRLTIRDVGYSPGRLPTGPTNSILDVPGVHVSQVTVPTDTILTNGSTAHKGITIISPRPPHEFYKPCRAGAFTFNGNGEVTGCRQIDDWGFTNTPLALTNSLSLGTAIDGMWDWILDQQHDWDPLTQARNYGTPVVGETCDWMINSDVRSSRMSPSDIKRAFATLQSGDDGGFVHEGQHGGGAGMTCHMFAGGTGTSSRRVGGGPGSKREYTLGVLCQSNYGRLDDLSIGGVKIGTLLSRERQAEAGERALGEGEDMHAASRVVPPPGDANRQQQQKERSSVDELKAKDGSIVIVIVTDAPLQSHNLARLARHATAGLTQVGTYGVGRNFSGDIFLALSTADEGPQQLEDAKLTFFNPTQTYMAEAVKNESVDTYFYAVTEAVEEAILNSMVGGREGVVGMDGKLKIEGFPVEKIRGLLEKHLVV